MGSYSIPVSHFACLLPACPHHRFSGVRLPEWSLTVRILIEKCSRSIRPTTTAHQWVVLVQSAGSYSHTQITENRTLNAKYDELKLQGHFIRSSPEFYKTDWVIDSATGFNGTTSPAAFVTFLQNPDTKAGFYIARQRNSTTTYVVVCPVLVAVMTFYAESRPPSS